MANQIALAKPGQTDEYYYQQARRVVIAELQHITYTEYLPILIGNLYFNVRLEMFFMYIFLNRRGNDW